MSRLNRPHCRLDNIDSSGHTLTDSVATSYTMGNYGNDSSTHCNRWKYRPAERVSKSKEKNRSEILGRTDRWVRLERKVQALSLISHSSLTTVVWFIKEILHSRNQRFQRVHRISTTEGQPWRKMVSKNLWVTMRLHWVSIGIRRAIRAI